MERAAVETSRGTDEKAGVGRVKLEKTGAREVGKGTKVMVALDDSDGSLYALKWTIEQLLKPQFELRTSADEDVVRTASPESGMIILVNVQQPFQPFVYPAGPVIYPTSSVIESVKKAQAENATALLGRAFQICKDNRVKAETLIMEGDPKEKICDVVEELRADLLVVGSRGLGKIKRAFLGSVSDYCAHHAQCPVLIVKPPPGHQ